MKIDYEAVARMKERVFIALPCGENARSSDFYASRDAVVCPPNTARQSLFGIYIANLQNELARLFLQTDFEYFWLNNDDQLYPADTLLRLLKADKDIVVPLCLEKKAPHVPLIYGPRNEDGTHYYRHLRQGERGLIPVGSCGGGGTLIHRRVFETVPDPWWTVQMCARPDGKMEQTSEDFDFCDKAAQYGFQVWCDLEAIVVHLAQYGLRARRDVHGNWYTILIRGDEEIAIPAAAPAYSLIQAPKMAER